MTLPSNLSKLFKPKSLAVIGVSLSNPFNPANVIYNKNRHRFSTKTYCVNPKGGSIYGQKIYTSISQIPDKIALAVISTKADFVPNILLECIAKGVSGAVVISGGFRESGREDLEENIREISVKNNFPVVGPNCLGLFSPPHTDTFFLPSERLITIKKGNVSLISQSGGILVDMMIKLTQEGVGISKAVSIGNKAVLDETAMLQYFKKDPETEVIGIYLEGFRAQRGRVFINEVNSSEKPIVIIKSGKTPGGSRAVSSHTAAIAGDYRTFSEIVKASKCFEATNESELVSYCEVLSAYPNVRVRKACIITASGGHGAIASDGCYNAGIDIPTVPDDDCKELTQKLNDGIKSIASLSNPIDLTGSALDEDFIAAVEFFMKKKYIDFIMLLLLPYLPGITSDIGARIAEVADIYKKPIVAYMPHVDKYGIFIEGFENNGIPVAHSVEGAVYMAAAIKGADFETGRH
jgi:acyl-CoA synthetase (NDP forming)